MSKESEIVKMSMEDILVDIEMEPVIAMKLEQFDEQARALVMQMMAVAYTLGMNKLAHILHDQSRVVQ